MGKFKIGDRVIDCVGNTATVVGTTETVRVRWDGGDWGGMWPAEDFELLPRKFKPGQYVRIIAADPDYGNETGIVFEDDGDDEENMPYMVGLFDELQSENDFSASELIPWTPRVGERVIEAGVEEDEVGTVIGWANIITARVLWDSFPHAQDWLVSDLEPADESEPSFDDGGPYNEINVGDEVEYTNPFFAVPSRAIVTHTDGESIGVKFSNGPFGDGFYHKDFFSKAA